jgi:biotin-dependent carboxylase-like uncharacterized protein
MTTAQFTVLQAGPQVTVQDAGRAGLMRYGVPASGPMDRLAYHVANIALGNPSDFAAIEVSLGGLSLCCTEGKVSFAVAGGVFHISQSGRTLEPWVVATIQAGETLTLRRGRWGSWCYLAFAGQLLSPRWLGSASTYGPSGQGGGVLVAGGTLQVDAADQRLHHQGPIAIPVSARPRRNVRLVLGPQDRFFAADTITTLLSCPYTLTDAYDRMGVRLSGPSLSPNASLDMPSEAIVRGSIQVAGDGVATVLLADHQTTGGYPKIATILSDDLDGFVQLQSRDSVRFQAITPQEAIAAARTRRTSFESYLKQWAEPIQNFPQS